MACTLWIDLKGTAHTTTAGWAVNLTVRRPTNCIEERNLTNSILLMLAVSAHCSRSDFIKSISTTLQFSLNTRNLYIIT